MLLLLAIALLALLAGRLRIPYPVFLVCGGLAIALIPGIPRLDLRPDVVFLVFLPPLLYAAAFNASPRDLRAEAGRIALLAVALVVVGAWMLSFAGALVTFPHVPLTTTS